MPYTPAPYQGHSDTSEAAAHAIAKVSAPMRTRVLMHITAMGAYGATDEEVQGVLAMRVQTETARRSELANVGLVIDSGQRRLTQTKRKAVVWVAPQFASAATLDQRRMLK